MAPKRCLCSGVTICGKRYFASVTSLPCGGPLLILIFPDGPSVITRGLLRAQQDVKEIWRCCAAGCDDNEGSMSQGIQVTFRNWKSWGNEFSRGERSELWGSPVFRGQKKEPQFENVFIDYTLVSFFIMVLVFFLLLLFWNQSNPVTDPWALLRNLMPHRWEGSANLKNFHFQG